MEAYGDAIIEANDIMLRGNVGIGDFTPSVRLDVDGGVRFRKLPAGTGTSLMINDGYVIRFGSSERYKEDIEEFEADGEAVLSLRPVRFRYKDTGQEDIGLIAEEVAKQASELVIYDAEGRPDAVKYDRICLYLLDAVRELKSENEKLKEKINAMEKSISDGYKEGQ